MGKKKHVNRVSRRSVTAGKTPVKKGTKGTEDGLDSSSIEEIAVRSGEDTKIDLIKPPNGLQNIGNTCFFNSVIQSLFTMHININLEINRNYLQTLSCAIADSFQTLHSLKKGNFKPSAIFDVIAKHFPQFKGRRQQDSHELYISLLSRFDDEIKLAVAHNENNGHANDNEKHSSKTLEELDFTSNFMKPFEGKLVSVVTCSECNSRSATLDPIYDISLEIPGSAHLRVLPPPKKKDAVSTRGGKKQKGKGGTSVSANSFEALGDLEESLPTKSDDMVDVIGSGIDCLAINENLLADAVLMSTHLDDPVNNYQEAILSSPTDGISEILTACQPTAAHLLAATITEADLPTENEQHGDPTIFDCLNSFTSVENLLVSEGNGFDCIFCRDNCQPGCSGKRLVDAKRRISLLVAPKYLVLHLKRLLPGGKYAGFVQFPIRLDISAYVSKQAISTDCDVDCLQDGASKQDGDTKPEKFINGEDLDRDSTEVFDSHQTDSSPVETLDIDADYKSDDLKVGNDGQLRDNMYELCAVIVHQGGAYGGHYVAYVLRDTQWYLTSDTNIKRCEVTEVLKCQAYMLFYKSSLT